MKRPLPAAILLLTVVLAACGAAGSPSASTAGGLEGTSWALVSIDGHEPEVEVTPTLTIAQDGAVSGTAVCNTYMGTARMAGTSISLGPLATTRVACSGAAGVLERAFLTALDEADSYVIDSQGRLVLEGGAVLVFEPAEVPAAS